MNVGRTRPTRAEIDLGAIAHNTAELRRKAAAGAELMAVVKADGYGHGAVAVAQAALGAGATWLGVAILEEAVALRQGGIQAPILILGHVPPQQADHVVVYDLRVAVWDLALPRALSQWGQLVGKRVPVHLKLDTGMNRVGVRAEQAVDLARQIVALPGVELEGAFTHLACADAPEPQATEYQYRRFEAALAALGREGIRPRVCHAANSAGLLAHPAVHYDLVRPGIALYGLAPDPARPWDADLRPAMRLMSQVVDVREAAPGEGVSYGWEWSAPDRTRIATVPIGYADGYRRLFTNRGEMLLGGRRCRVVGRVCMDHTMIQVPPGLDVAPGDEVVLIGRQGDEIISADDWARALGTINYEVVCLIGGRVPRVYLPPPPGP